MYIADRAWERAHARATKEGGCAEDYFDIEYDFLLQIDEDMKDEI